MRTNTAAYSINMVASKGNDHEASVTVDGVNTTVRVGYDGKAIRVLDYDAGLMLGHIVFAICDDIRAITAP